MSRGELVLVTGGAGFIGSHTVDELLRRGYRVRVLDGLDPRIHPHGKPSYLGADVEFLNGDVCDRDQVDAALRGASRVFHFAAYQDYLPDFSKFVHVNVTSTALLYELIVERGHPTEKVVVASSQAVYGEGAYDCARDGEVYPPPRMKERLDAGKFDVVCPVCGGEAAWRLTTEARTSPHNQYALSKAAQESFALTLGRQHDIPTVALRYSIVQGPRQSFWNAYSGACRTFCLALFFKRAPVVYEDGRQLRDYVNIGDVVEANLCVLEHGDAIGQVFNVGGGRPWSVLELAEAAARVYGIDVLPEIPGVFRFGDTRHIVSDISKLRALGWEPRRSPEDSLRAYADWLGSLDNVEDVRDFADRQMRELNVLRPAREG